MVGFPYELHRAPLPPWRWIFVTTLVAFAILFPVGVAAFFYFACGRVMPWPYFFIVAVLSGFTHGVVESVKELYTVRISPTGVTWENNPGRFARTIASYTAMIVFMHVGFAFAMMDSELSKG